MEKRERIVMIGPVYPYKGGISHYTGMMYRELAGKHDVTMISYKKQYPRILFKKEQRDYENDSFRVEDTKYLINTYNPFNIIRVARWIKHCHPDMVIIQWWHPYFAPCYRILTTFMGKQNITFVCHNVFPHERFPLDRWLARMTLRKGSNFILHAQNEETELDKIVRTNRKKVTPHPTYEAFKMTGIGKTKARERLGLLPQEKILLFFGFVREYKGLGYLLDAMPEISGKLSDVRLLVVGDFSEDKGKYLDKITALGIKEKVFIRDGYIPDSEVEPYFAACDLVVVPYVSATQSGIVQIAYGFDKPVIATNVGGLPDVVKDGETGYLIEPQSSKQIADAVNRYFELNKEAEFEQNIKKDAERFSWKRMGEVIDGFFE